MFCAFVCPKNLFLLFFPLSLDQFFEVLFGFVFYRGGIKEEMQRCRERFAKCVWIGSGGENVAAVAANGFRRWESRFFFPGFSLTNEKKEKSFIFLLLHLRHHPKSTCTAIAKHPIATQGLRRSPDWECCESEEEE